MSAAVQRSPDAGSADLSARQCSGTGGLPADRLDVDRQRAHGEELAVGAPTVLAVAFLQGQEHGSGLVREACLADWDGVAEGAGFAPQDRQVVPEVADRLTLSVGAAVPRDAPCRRPHLNVLRVRP